jgi:uncharacterized protein
MVGVDGRDQPEDSGGSPPPALRLKIVLDMNIVVSGLLNPEGNPGRALDLFLAGEVTLLADDRILAECRAVLRRPRFGLDAADVSDFLDLLEAESVRVVATPLGFKLPDKSDRAFLEVTLAGGAESLVTGSVRHFRCRTSVGFP